jgi:hypothetical protein
MCAGVNVGHPCATRIAGDPIHMMFLDDIRPLVRAGDHNPFPLTGNLNADGNPSIFGAQMGHRPGMKSPRPCL